MDVLGEITLDDIPEEQHFMVELIGIEAYVKLTKYYGGDRPFISKYETLRERRREEYTKQNFNGKNYDDLMKLLSLSKADIRRLLRRKDKTAW